MMSRVPNPLIESLAEDLQPVRPLRMAAGALLIVLATLATILAVEIVAGLWNGMLTGEASPLYYVTKGLLGMLGLASAWAVLHLACPHVGNRHDGPTWGAAMAATLPLSALIYLVNNGLMGEALRSWEGVECMLASLAASSVTFIALVLWLRRGAPVSLNSAGWLTGLAAGSLGTFAHGLACPIDNIGHLGVWHVAPVLICTILGRLAVPSLVRW